MLEHAHDAHTCERLARCPSKSYDALVASNITALAPTRTFLSTFLSKMYRRFYFLCRSLVTLNNFCGALNRLNAVKDCKESVEGHGDRERRQLWAEARRGGRPFNDDGFRDGCVARDLT